MIDLHIHTNYSGDGSYDIKEVLTMAESIGLDYISITDHDTIEAYEQLTKLNIADYYLGIIIPGIELKVIYNGIPIEILGYDIDTEAIKPFILEWSKQKYIAQLKQLDRLKVICTELGLKFNPNLKLTINDWAANTMYYELIQYEDNKKILEQLNILSDNDFYRNHICNKEDVFYIAEQDTGLSLMEAADRIWEAGGKTFLAHPYGVYNVDNPDQLIEELIKTGYIDGIECYHPAISEEQSRQLEAYCHKNRLYKSGGSDSHNILRPIGKANEEVIDNKLIKEWKYQKIKMKKG